MWLWFTRKPNQVRMLRSVKNTLNISDVQSFFFPTYAYLCINTCTMLRRMNIRAFQVFWPIPYVKDWQRLGVVHHESRRLRSVATGSPGSQELATWSDSRCLAVDAACGSETSITGWCLGLAGNFRGMIHFITSNNHPSNPQQPIHSLRLAPPVSQCLMSHQKHQEILNMFLDVSTVPTFPNSC